MEILRLELLGGMSVCQGNRLLSAELSKKAQALLCYLAVTAHPHSRDTLAGLLWSDFSEQRARANLRDTLSRLHRALPQHLVIERSSISFVDIPARTWIDSAVFQMHVEQVQQILRNTPSPAMLSPELIGQVEEAVGLYRGEFLAEFYVRRAAVFEDWAARRQEHLRQLAVEALQILTTYYTSSGDYPAGLRTARQLLEMDPWREEGHRLLMRLLALSGQQSAAIKQYEICHQVLEQELGLEPTKETTILYEAIRGGEIQPGKLDTRGYELVQLIGQGATSAVYIAYQPMIKREVAIKIILPEFASDPTFFERFGSVAQTVAQLEFPWIVPIYDYWRDVDAAYMIMRLMRGGNLRDKLDRPWNLEAVVTLVTQVASALAAAHEAGVIHGNLQPTNILLDEDGNAFLSDFGTAGGDCPSSTNRYLSPEQRRSEPATRRADIYTLGLLVYEMLADKENAQRAQDRQGDGSNEALANDLASTLALKQDGLAAGVVEVIQRATAYKPDDRFPDVLAMASALRRALESEQYGRLPVAAGIVQRRGSRLPLDETPFIGRKEELFMLDKLIADPKVRLINITGPGGIGKTRLVLASARRQVGRFKHGVTFVSLISLEQANQIIPAIAAALELPLQDQGSPQQQLFDYLQNKHLLLILDGFEHLMTGKGVLAEMVAHAPQLTIIVTSREVLHLREEQLFPLTGLTLSDSEAAEDVFQADAPQLFLSSVRRLQPDFCLYESDFDALNRICQLVEGMPLAIELAAGWANKIALARIATQLRQSMDFLRTDDGNMTDRHASIQAAFTTSWQQLDGQDQQVFKKLSVFRGGFSLEAARQISGISFVSLSRLVSKSLLQFERATDRYQMHELLRQFAAMKLAQDRDEEKAVLASHAIYFCALLGEKEKDLKGLRQDIALTEIETDLGNIRKALRTAAKHNFVDLIAQGLSSFNLYHRYRFLPDEFINTCQVIGGHLQKLVDGSESPMLARRVLAKIKVMQATPYMHATIGSDYLATMESLQVLERSRDVFCELAAHGEDVRKEQAFVLKRLGALLLNIELTRALPLLEKSLALYQQLGDCWGQSEALFYLSSGRMRLQGYLDAKPLWEESLALKRVEGDRRGLADSLAMLGIRAASHNQTADALQYAHECHDTYMRINDPTSRAEAHWNLGVLMTWAGQYAESKEILTKADALYGELGLSPPALILGNTLAMLGEYDAVVEYVEKYMTGVGEAGFKPNEARAYTWLCYVALARKDYGEARRLSQKSIAAFEACGLKAYAGVLCGLLAMSVRREGEQLSPWRYLEKGLRIQQDRNQLGPLGIWMIAPVTAALLADAGYVREAVTAYAFACNHPMIANSVWFNDVMGDVVRKAATQLSPAVAAQARQEGQAAEPWSMGAKLLQVVSDFASL